MKKPTDKQVQVENIEQQLGKISVSPQGDRYVAEISGLLSSYPARSEELAISDLIIQIDKGIATIQGQPSDVTIVPYLRKLNGGSYVKPEDQKIILDLAKNAEHSLRKSMSNIHCSGEKEVEKTTGLFLKKTSTETVTINLKDNFKRQNDIIFGCMSMLHIAFNKDYDVVAAPREKYLKIDLGDGWKADVNLNNDLSFEKILIYYRTSTSHL